MDIVLQVTFIFNAMFIKKKKKKKSLENDSGQFHSRMYSHLYDKYR